MRHITMITVATAIISNLAIFLLAGCCTGRGQVTAASNPKAATITTDALPAPQQPAAPVMEVATQPVYQFGQPVMPSAEVLKEIQQELLTRMKEDQAVRTNAARYPELAAVDAANVKYLKELTQQYGWIDTERFGKMAAQVAFLLVQHSGDMPLMEAALSPIKADVLAKHMSGDAYALLYDRIQIHKGNKQRYGSQLLIIGDTMTMSALEDPRRVDEFRAELGMMPLKDYVAQLCKMTNKQCHYADPELNEKK